MKAERREEPIQGLNNCPPHHWRIASPDAAPLDDFSSGSCVKCGTERGDFSKDFNYEKHYIAWERRTRLTEP